MWFTVISLKPNPGSFHFRTLQVVYNKYEKSDNELLILTRDMLIYQKHSYFLAKKVYKSVNYLNPQFTCNYFNFSTLPYELRIWSNANCAETRTCSYEINSLLFRGSLQLNNLPRNVKERHSVEQLKEILKELRSLTCSYVVHALTGSCLVKLRNWNYQSLLGNTFQWRVVSHRNQSFASRCYLVDFFLWRGIFYWDAFSNRL